MTRAASVNQAVIRLSLNHTDSDRLSGRSAGGPPPPGGRSLVSALRRRVSAKWCRTLTRGAMVGADKANQLRNNSALQHLPVANRVFSFPERQHLCCTPRTRVTVGADTVAFCKRNTAHYAIQMCMQCLSSAHGAYLGGLAAWRPRPTWRPRRRPATTALLPGPPPTPRPGRPRSGTARLGRRRRGLTEAALRAGRAAPRRPPGARNRCRQRRWSPRRRRASGTSARG